MDYLYARPILNDHECHVVDTLETPGPFGYYIDVLGILSEIHLFMRKKVDIGDLSDIEEWNARFQEADKRLRSWKAGLPPQYGNMSILFNLGGHKAVTPEWIMLHATYHTYGYMIFRTEVRLKLTSKQSCYTTEFGGSVSFCQVPDIYTFSRRQAAMSGRSRRYSVTRNLRRWP